MHDGGLLIIKEGQLITSREKLAEASGLSPSTIERALKFLESEQQIEQHTTTKYRLITIVNWKDYQESGQPSGQPMDSRRHTNKNDKNVKKNTTTAQGADDDTSKFIFLFKPINPSLERLYGRPPQREAAQRLLKLHPLEWWERFMPAYATKFPERFCPKATTPIQLEEKLGQIVGYAERIKRDAVNSRNQVVI
jgi:hypothetical protein